jgi:hypothetical protein
VIMNIKMIGHIISRLEPHHVRFQFIPFLRIRALKCLNLWLSLRDTFDATADSGEGDDSGSGSPI